MVELLSEIINMKPRESNDIVPQILNDDVIYDIMLKLPIQSLVRFRALSKYWKEAITSREFFKQRKIISLELSMANTTFIKCYYFMKLRKVRIYAYQIIAGTDSQTPLRGVELGHPIPDGVHMDNLCVHSESLCDGLLGAVYNKARDEQFVDYNFLVWNPFTGRHKEIPLPEENYGEQTARYQPRVGFGYDATIDDYKIVVILKDFVNGTASVMVRTLKCDEWRAVYFAQSERIIYRPFIKVVVVDGDVWWIAARGESYVLIRFHLAKEKLSIVALPPKANPKGLRCPYRLRRHDESLYLFDYGHEIEFYVWRIVKKGNETVWELVRRIPAPAPPYSIPFGFTGDGALVAWINEVEQQFYACISSNGNLFKFELQGFMGSESNVAANEFLLDGETLISP